MLITERLTLRMLRDEDAARLQVIAGDRAVAEMYSEIPHPFTIETAGGMIEASNAAIQEGTRLVLGMRLRETDELIGVIGLETNLLHRRAELGYFIDVAHWGRGYATEAARAMVRHAFDVLGLHRVEARHMVDNPASARVLEKIGMRQEGVLRESIERFGRFHDAVVWGLLSADE